MIYVTRRREEAVEGISAVLGNPLLPCGGATNGVQADNQERYRLFALLSQGYRKPFDLSSLSGATFQHCFKARGADCAHGGHKEGPLSEQATCLCG
jgi:hypothetical protein